MAALTIATERPHRLLMTAGPTQATHHALKAELHVDGGSGARPIALGAGASRGLVVRPRPVTTLTLVEAPWYAVGLALIRSGALLWKEERNSWGLVMIVIGARDLLEAFAEEARRRAAAVATAGAAAGAASARVRARSSLMIRPRPVTTLTLVEQPWYAVGLALIRSGAMLWRSERNPWGIVMIAVGAQDSWTRSRRRPEGAPPRPREAAAGAVSAPVERPAMLMVRSRTSTTLMLAEGPWLALILAGALLWAKERNPWGIVMILAGVQHCVDASADEEGRERAASGGPLLFAWSAVSDDGNVPAWAHADDRPTDRGHDVQRIVAGAPVAVVPSEPFKAGTRGICRHVLDKHILPHLGATPLSEIDAGAVARGRRG